jgi:23S rRNA (adenine2503-C2)-methyltransferase
MHIEALRHRLRALGSRPVHEERVLRQWSRAESQAQGRRRPADFLPLALRQALPALEAELRALAVLRSDHAGADGSRRLLVGLVDGRSVEAVLLPRGGLCVSSQLGCAVGCVFCMTGLGGLERQLGSAEIVAQVALARSLRAVTKVVFMGMGEPAHNLDAVLEAIDLLGTGGGIGHKQLVFSTVGDRRAFERLPRGRVKPALALSLHSSDAALRTRLLPRAPAIAPDELVALGDAYARATGYPMQVQWTLLDGINDTAAEIEGLVRLLAGRHAVLNLIPYNSVDGLTLARPSPERARAMVCELQRRGILTKLRQSAGQDVQAGCGQLRARHEPGDKRVFRIASQGSAA